MSDANKPRLRAVVLDARAPSSSTRDAAGALRERNEPIPLPGARAERNVEVRFAFAHGTGTRELVAGAVGVDVIVVTAGPRVAHVARHARILRAAGARAAVISLPSTTIDAEVERNVRHLITGIGLSGDDAVAVPSSELIDAVARAVPPRAVDGFLVVGRPVARGGRIVARVIAGSFEKGAVRAHVLGVDGFEERSVQRAEPGDDEQFTVSIGAHNFRTDDDVVIASERVVCAKRFVATNASARAIGAEPCALFGGNGGWATGTIKAGVIDVDRPVCPRDGRVGLVLFKGAGLGPVSAVDAFPIAPRKATVDDEDALFDLAKVAIRDQIVATYGPWDDAWQRNRFHETFRADDVFVYVDEHGPFAMLDVHDPARAAAEDDAPNALYISRVYVAPRAQCAGVGTLIVRDVIEQARRRRVDVALRVLRVNERARALYARIGFVVVAEGEKHFAMRFASASAS